MSQPEAAIWGIHAGKTGDADALFLKHNVVAASEREARLLREFEDAHWELPVLNAQRGYARDEDTHFRRRRDAV
jgi:hypothetical protein